MRPRFAFLWVLVTALIAGIAAYIAYGAGVATHLTVAAGTDGAAYGYYHPFWGFGLFFPILFIVLLFWFLRPRRWGRGGWGGYGMRGGFPQGVPPHLEERLRDWHSKVHGEPGSESTPMPPTGGGPISA
jgi:hypothetical protein